MARTIRVLPSSGTGVEPRIEAVLRVLGDPTRLRIFRMLREGEACVCEIAAELSLAENLVSHHLRALREIGLVHDRRDPSDTRWVYYHLSTAALGQIRAEMGTLLDPYTVGVRTPTCGPVATKTMGAAGPARAADPCCAR
jgi:ArsR family transcriptional regulator